MQDVQNYQYYDPNPGLPPEPWWKRKRVWQLAALVGVAAAALVFATVMAMNALQNRQLARDEDALMEQAAGIASQLETECEAGDTACVDRARADAARALGAAQACTRLSDQSFESCIILIAQDTLNPEVCKALIGESQQNCFDQAFLLLAQDKPQLATCKKIAASELRGACTAQVTAHAIATNTCAATGVDVAECQALDALRDAMLSGDPAVCEALPDEQDRADCIDAIWSVDDDGDGLVLADEVGRGLLDTVSDSDGDGLSDGDEVHVYLTNPAVADTDADGFDDGTEVDGGYDPLT
jgi:hypothetical protein